MNLKLQSHIEKELDPIGLFNSNFIWKSIGGGSINQVYKVFNSQQEFFIKINSITVFQNGFKEEVLGLKFLKKNKAMVPEIINEGIFENYIYLVLEWIEEGEQNNNFWKNFALQLSELHRHKSDSFGLKYDNFMGELLQKNTFKDNFTDFFIENRLKPQVEMAFNKGLLKATNLIQFENLYIQLTSIFPTENPCAIHGDLWSGNFIANEKEKAVFIDPAVYHGHREIDLAMSLLFGGFKDEFYTTYQEIYPLEKGFIKRKDIYNMYPLLVHLNLFGSTYYSSIDTIVSKF